MKKNRILLIAAIALISLSISSCSSTFSFVNVDTPDNEIYIERGKSFQVSENRDVAISLHGKKVTDNQEATMVAAITNKSKVSNFDFNDSSINIYGGNIDKNDWTLISNWNANSYYKRALSQANARALITALNGAFLILNSGNDNDYSQTTYYSNGLAITSTSNNSNILISSMLASNDMRNVLDDNSKSMDYLENNLLYSSSIKPNSSYLGVFYFPIDNNQPDYKIVYKDADNDLNFYFNRSDRAEILNPFLDKSRARNSLVVGYSPINTKVDLTYYYSNPRFFGIYTGMTSYNILKEESKLIVDDYKGVGQTFGLTIKTIPYTWLLLGVEYSYGIQKTSTTNIYKHYIGPQVGLNFIVSDLDVSTKVTWQNYNKKDFTVDVGLGIAL